ncbi:mersacidin/lichenicidin family type 2 lantibiotic [Nocardiopsis sp. MG754419]|uniref:mersacidin/lichenicidin family type 2 lantibiotic n=1 Tax=Nocardiopsis sp. MG754419 TaxID=2259865 RepID=UPI001BAB529E|nr:mersacidin/lichenicidin family type 2 lantibiotic [Nocardiopsis sp. MG754419]MBR8741840.1 mersacidin/lichenicidin family type 2 lantibiotic [Nocardiopsis sp. MG754419]
MTKIDIIRAWKDPEYRDGLTSAPAHPAGVIELPDEALNESGGAQVMETETGWSFGCCDSVTLDPVSGACFWYC